MTNKKLHMINLDDQTMQRLERFQKENGLSRSASIRLIINQALGRNDNHERKTE